MSIIAANPVEAILGTVGPLGRDQAQIKVYFADQGEVAKAGQQSANQAFQPQLTNEEAWSTDEITTILSALAEIETMVNVGFVQTNDQSDADLDFVKNDNVDGSTGYTVGFDDPDAGSDARQSSVVINHTISSGLLFRSPWSDGYEIGTYGYQVLLTMVGAALGLGFTHNEGQGSKILPGLSPQEPFQPGPDFLNDSINSVMANGIGYDRYDTIFFQSGGRGTFGAWDIAALEAIYGVAGPNNSGNDVYQLNDNFAAGPAYYKTIYDTGGNDWIMADSFSDAQIDLGAATLDFDPVLSGGGVSFSLGAGSTLEQDGFTIANGTVIENARGQFGDDTLIGNDAANVLEGGAGRDLILPGLGKDTLDGGADRDEYAGTVAELSGDVILSIEDLDRIYVYDVAYADADVSVISQGGQTLLVADNGQPGARLEMVLDPAIGLAPGQINLFTTPRDGDTIISFAQSDDFGNTIATAEPFSGANVSSFDIATGIEYGIIETAGDTDFFDLLDNKFADILVEVVGASANGGSLSTPVLEIFDDAGTLLYSDTGTGPGGVSRVIIPEDTVSGFFEDGVDHYIAVSGATSGDLGSYTLRARIADDFRSTIPSESELLLNDIVELTPFTTPLKAELEQASDLDVFRLRVAAGASYEINAKGLPNYQGAITDTRIQIFDGAGNQLAVNNNGGPGTDARLVYTAPQDGDVFVSISAGSGSATVNTGPYEILFDPSDDFADLADYAQLIEVDGGVINGALETGADADWFAIWLEAGQTYTILADTALSGPELELYDPFLNSLEVRDVDFFGVDFDYTPTFSGVYRISMQSEFGVSADAYTLEVKGPPTGAGSVRVGTLGNDSLTGGGTADLISALEGDDTVSGLGGGDTISAGPGNDSVLGSAGADVAVGGSGADRIFGEGGNDYLQGEDGDDYLNGGNKLDTLEGGRGDDTLIGEIGMDSLVGGAGNDVIQGGNANDTLDGGAGNDTLRGQGEADALLGGPGRDSLLGGASADTLDGGDDADTADGGAFNDLVQGGAGDDLLLGGSGLDTLDGGTGDDSLNGGAGGDDLDGGVGADTLLGGIGDDSLVGGGDADILDGGNADDTLDGGPGADTVTGGSGSDLLRVASGEGGDLLSGGAGLDRFDFEGGFGTATITDFSAQDLIDLGDALAASQFSDLSISYGADATVTFGGDSLVLLGITGGLDAGDFLF